MLCSTVVDQMSAPFKLDPRFIPTLACAAIVMSQLSNFVFAPALPEISRYFSISAGHSQMLMSVFLAGYASVQIVVGPLADGLGRRPVLIGGVSLLALGAIIAALAPMAGGLFAGIFILSLGAGMLPTVGQAMIRDSRDTDGTLMILTRLGTALALASALTPLIGTSLVGTVGWRGLFLALAVVVLALLPFVLGSPETLAPPPRARPAGASPLALALNGYRAALGQRQLVLYSIMIGCLTGALTIFFIGAPFLFIHQLGVSVHTYGILAFVAFTPFIAGSVFVRVSLRRRWLSLHANILLGCAIAVAGAAIGWLTSIVAPAPAPILLSAGLFTFGLGIAVVVGRSAALLEATRDVATSSALVTFLMTVLAAAISAVAGAVETVEHAPIFSLMFLSTVAGLTAAWAGKAATQPAIA